VAVDDHDLRNARRLEPGDGGFMSAVRDLRPLIFGLYSA
jgi:hypothetical protein